MIEGIGPEAGETRFGTTTPFDNVNDYNGYNSAADGGIKDITGTLIPDLIPYQATVAVAVAPVALGGIASTDANGQANVLLITVTVTGPANTTVVLNGYRTKYSPRI